MHKSKCIARTRRNSDENRCGTHNEHHDSTSSRSNEDPDRKQRYHPYQRNKKGSGNDQQFPNRDQNNWQYFSFTRLKTLSEMNCDDCVAELANKKDHFDQLLNEVLRPDLLVLTIKVLSNICRANFTEVVTSVISRACSATFLRSVENYLTRLPFESGHDKLSNKLYWEDRQGFWNKLLQLFKKITEILPTKARDELITVIAKTKSIITTIETNQDYKIDESIKDAILKIHDELKEEITKFEAINQVEDTLLKLEKSEDPPENFRTLNIIPTIQDLNDNYPFIRPCKLKGAYDSIEHYLDVQFRLLREDFIAPLREGIREYLHGQKTSRNTQLRIYKNVTLEEPKETGNDLRIVVSFGILRKVNWNHSKRFLFGGLVCLSNDNFDSILFATVANRDEKLLQSGAVLIEPCRDNVITKDFYKPNWVMLESKIYFEPYLVVLNAMCHMNEDNFPMKKYLVDADTSTSLPLYLRSDKEYPETDPVLKYKGFSLPIGNGEAWPEPEMLGFDETQFEALKSAITEEFAIIQGPPGTGKTFIALQIIRTLLENKSYWRNDGPIIILCLTNHALDQFLEGILLYTESIVRVGSRSKSEALSAYTLAERKKTLSSADKNNRSVAVKYMNTLRYEAQAISAKIERARLAWKYLMTKDAIVPFKLLYSYCQDRKLRELGNYDKLLQWLMEDNDDSTETEIEPGEIRSDTEMEVEENFDENFGNFEDWPMSSDTEHIPQFNTNDCERPVFLLQAIDAHIHEIQAEMNQYKQYRNATRFQVDQFEYSMSTLKLQHIYVQRNLTQHPLLTTQKEKITLNPRWQAYWKWVEFSYNKVVFELNELEAAHRHATLRFDEAKQIADLELLRNYDIVGFTTTSAARLHASLCALHAPIVVVEEAAEILESHVVCSLTKSCQHVILIGDHKQLRPKAAVHRLGNKYNLNISLFERMVNTRGSCTQLAHQHRMRPEIAGLICPSIYETLHNHQSVLKYPSVTGLEKNIFFINHENREESQNNQESWSNPHEAKFLVAFARHLILQGYRSTEITILCTYTSQLFTLITERDYYSILRDVRITTIDNYQGEENRIILLSLVRNNKEGYIGFLKEENRVCVALSRAREGLYIMGNMDNLTTNNDVWPKVKNVLIQSNAIGDSLELRCKYHPDKLINVQKASDFEQCPEGGCLQNCNTDLPCGHVCTSICHTSDRRHENFTCKQRCGKRCADNHPCPLLCHRGCQPCKVTVDRQLNCGHTVHIACGIDPDTYLCPVQVDVILPDCKHTVQKACYLPVDECQCTHSCEIRLPCGHSCTLNCHVKMDPDHLNYVCSKPCSKNNADCTMNHPCKLQCHEKCIPCPVLVSKIQSCGHDLRWRCSGDIERVLCFKLILYERSCGHKVVLKCCQKDEECEEKVIKKGQCGHNVRVKCHQIPSLSHCSGKCKRKLECGHPCTARCKDKCTTKCNFSIPRTEPGLCGHMISVPCHLKEIEANTSELLQYCNEPCKAELACGHTCKGNCRSCKQGRIHQSCGEKCGNILICGHKCKVPCRQECPPCQQPCQVKCRHSKCNRKCGEVCVPCKELCTARCRHTVCMKRCSDLCVRKPCTKPCPKLLKCKHQCIGFCGEPCPQLCRICDKKELMDEFFLGHEEEPTARFVLLEDCGHCIESRGLLKWVSECHESIQARTCPRCKTPINECARMSNEINKSLKDLELVKKKIFGDYAKLEDQQLLFIIKIRKMKNNPTVNALKDMNQFLTNLDARVAFVTKDKRRQTLNAQSAETIRITLDFVQEICDKFAKIINQSVRSYPYVNKQISMLVESLPTRGQISNQKIKDIERELQRLHYMTEVCIMESEADLEYSETSADEKPYNSLLEKLSSIGKFSETIEEEIVQDLNKLRMAHHAQVVLKNTRKMIVKVMGFKQGHWFKCPNGHIYSIGECGGAMQSSKCNECGAAIGGHSHRLASGNSVATEMDGASRSAWPGGV